VCVCVIIIRGHISRYNLIYVIIIIYPLNKCGHVAFV
jgi:hypothetical protein